MKMPAGLDAVDDLDAADLDHSVAAQRVQSGGFSVEDDFAHGANYLRDGDSETSENVTHLLLSCG